MNEYEDIIARQPKIKFCPSCKKPIEQVVQYTFNAFECPNCKIRWNIQYLKLR